VNMAKLLVNAVVTDRFIKKPISIYCAWLG
jgi:hypothetical protein